MSPKNLLEFIHGDGNILVALSGTTPISTTASSLLLELDISTSPDRSSIVVDHFNYDTLSASDKHDVLVLPRPSPLRSDVKPFFSGDGVLALPRTVGQALGSNNPLLAPVLRAPETAYSYDPRDDAKSVDDPFATGGQLSLVSTAQARNSARLTVLGSAESLEDKWFSADVKSADGKQTKTANREFAQQLSAWAFKETGVLKVGKVEHYLNEGGVESVSDSEEPNPPIYRIKNDVVCNKRKPKLLVPSSANVITPRLSTLSCPSIPTTTMFHMKSLPPMKCSSNSPCFLPSTASISSPLPALKIAPSTALLSPYPISMVSSTSVSTTNARSSPTSTKSMKSPSATLPTTNTPVAGRLPAAGYGLQGYGLSLPASWLLLSFGFTVSRPR